MADEVTILPADQPYTGHGKAFATVKETRAFTEVKTYPDGILVTRHDERQDGRSSTVLLPWQVIEALVPHHHAAQAHAGLARTEAAGKRSRAVKAKSATAASKATPADSTTPSNDAAEARRLQALRVWQVEKARRSGVPPYIIAFDRALRNIARSDPTTMEALAKASGWTESKLAQHGPGALEALDAIRPRQRQPSGADLADRHADEMADGAAAMADPLED